MFRTEVWLVTTLFCVGVIAGMVAVWPSTDIPDFASISKDKESENISDSGFELRQPLQAANFGASQIPTDAGANQVDLELLVEARSSLMAGGYDRAAKLFRKQIEHISLREPGSAANKFVWLGISEELAGRVEAAELAYSTALRGQPDKAGRSVAIAGLTRTWLAQKRFDEAIGLLTDVFLQSDIYAPDNSWLQAESRWLLATAMRNLALDNPVFARSKQPVYFLEPAFNLEVVIELLSPEITAPKLALSPTVEEPAIPESKPEEPSPLPAKRPGVQAVQLPSNQMDLITLDINLDTQPIFAIAQQVVAIAEVTLDVDPSARTRMTGRSKAVHTSDQNAAAFLDVLLAPLGLEWKQVDDVVHVFENTSLAESPFRLAMASRLYFQFTIQNQSDNRQGYVQLNIGNIALMNGDFDSASSAYQGAIQSGVTGELLSRILANQAMLNRALGRNDRSISDLYHAIDSSYDQELHGELWSQLSEIALGSGRIDEAITAATRAIRISGSDASVGRAAIALASAYMFKNNPWAANQAIFEAQSVLENSSMADAGRFLGSYSRLLGSRSELAKKRETTRLLESLAKLNSSEKIPAAVGWLAARAWAEFGMDENAIAAVGKTLETANDEFWVGRLSWELAKIHQRGMQNEQAFSILEHLAESSEDESGRQARIELARMQLQAGEPAKCLSTLQVLFATAASEPEKRDALKVMGDAYSVSGQPYAAALCYAGMLPEANVVVIENPETSGNAVNTSSPSPVNN